MTRSVTSPISALRLNQARSAVPGISPRVAGLTGLDHSEFEREPSPEVAAIPARMIL